MPLTHLELTNFRLFERAVFDFHPRKNLSVGGNAAGKSTILEAIQYLGTGKSSRCKNTAKLSHHGTSGFTIKSDISHQGTQHRVTVAYTEGEKKTSINGIPGVKVHEIARLLPISLMSPESHIDFQGESRQRRAAIDWILFHVEQDFQGVWSRYQRVLAQRNADLKQSSGSRSIRTWNEELAILGETIHEMRMDIVRKVQPTFYAVIDQILPEFHQRSLELKAGWDTAKGLGACLESEIDRDRREGFTHSGPHRSDVQLRQGVVSDISELSHGQKKMLFVSLKLASVYFLQETCGLTCTLMIDDLSAEIDKTRQESILKSLDRFAGQIILTSIDWDQDTKIWDEYRSFHVEHGSVSVAKKYKTL